MGTVAEKPTAKIQAFRVRDEKSGYLRMVGRVLGQGRPGGDNHCVVLHTTDVFGELDYAGAAGAARAWCVANGLTVVEKQVSDDG